MIAIIEAIKNGEIPNAEVALVISNNPQAPALEKAAKYGIETMVQTADGFSNREDYDRALIEKLESRGVDIVCLAGFMRIMSPVFVHHYKNRCLNIHPALLPSFPGLHAQRKALEYGVKFSGATVHFIDEGVDSGPIIIQEVVPVLDDDTEETLAARILEKEHKIYPEAIRLLVEGKLEIQGRRVLRKKD